MEDDKYVYVNPTEQGYTQFNLTRKQHNALFPKRRLDWRARYEYYYNEHMIIMHKFYNWKGILLITLLFPLSVLYSGIGNISEGIDDLKRLYNQKKRGAFTGDHVSAKSDLYKEILKLIEK